MSLSLALNTALSGLNVNQQALGVLSQNIANANTQGYSRQVLSQQAISIDGQDDGVSVNAITRQVDAYLTQSVQNQTSAVGQATAINNYHTQIQQLMGQPGSNNSVDTFVNGFFNDIQQLAAAPTSAGLQQTAVDAGVTLATQLQQTAQGLQKLQYQADQDIGTAVTAINNDLQGLGKINAQIIIQTSQGKSVADLQDQRDKLVTDIAQYMNIQTYAKSDGSITVSTGNGAPLLEGNDIYKLNYSSAGSADSFGNGTALSALTVTGMDSHGHVIGAPLTLATAGTPAQVTTTISSGQLAGLFSMRDSQIPNIQNQLDTLTSSIRDQINAVQNSGSSSPGVNGYTGQRAVNAGDFSQWSGKVQIAVLSASGQPIAQPYITGAKTIPPLNLDMSQLNTGGGAGNPSVQGIINEINQAYGPPQNKAQLSNLDNIQIASNTQNIATSSQFNFDFNLSNLSDASSNVYITGMSVTDSGGASMGSVTSTAPSVALNPTSTYVTNAGSGAVTVNTTGANHFINGQTVYLSTPGSAVDGIPAADLGGFFTVSNVTANSFQITAANGATASAGATTASAGQTAQPPYSTVAAGDTDRTTDNGTFTANLAANPTSPYYTVTATVAVDNGSGNPPTTAQITYQISNQQGNMLNNLYGAKAISSTGTLAIPTTTQPLAVATLVDAKGNELPKVNGQYVTNQNGYLQIKAGGSTNTIAINSLDSAEQGKPNGTPPQPGTNQGFSQYFGLNNFFEPNDLTLTGDTITGSALNLQVNKNLRDNPSLISTGQLTRSPMAAGSTAPSYSFERDAGDNSIIQQMAGLGTNNVIFPGSGGLGTSTQTFDAYAGEIVGAAASKASAATTNQTNAQTMLTGYTQQVSTTSGVNMNTELANTVIYQNAYAASARVITVTNSLFSTLLQSFGG